MWTDRHGTLTRRQLWRAVRRRARELPPGPLVVSESDQRTVVIDALAGAWAGRTVRIVPPRAGEMAVRRARKMGPGPRGVFFVTSGTTGASRVVHSRRGLAAAGQTLGTLGFLPAWRRPTVLSLASVSHGHGFTTLLGSLALGGHFIAAEGMEPGEALPGRVELLTGVPVQLREFATGPLAASVRVSAILSGSDQLRESDADLLARRITPVIFDAYGATEAGQIAIATPADRARLPGTVGRPLPGVRIRESGGRLLVRSPVLGRGAFVGDAGYIRDGLVMVTGRADGVSVSGGENVELRAVCAWVERRPGVVTAKASEIPDERFGTRFELHVTADGDLNPDELRGAIRAEFGAAATPAAVGIEVQRGGRQVELDP